MTMLVLLRSLGTAVWQNYINMVTTKDGRRHLPQASTTITILLEKERRMMMPVPSKFIVHQCDRLVWLIS